MLHFTLAGRIFGAVFRGAVDVRLIACAAMLLLLTACSTFVLPPDPPGLADQLAARISREAQFPHTYCLAIRPEAKGLVFAASTEQLAHISIKRATLLVDAGLYQPVETTDDLKALQRNRDGRWYAFTDLARTYDFDEWSGRMCFGTVSGLHITDLGTPERWGRDAFSRLVRYQYTVEGMPAFTQTKAYKESFSLPPVNGLNSGAQQFLLIKGAVGWGIPVDTSAIE